MLDLTQDNTNKHKVIMIPAAENNEIKSVIEVDDEGTPGKLKTGAGEW